MPLGVKCSGLLIGTTWRLRNSTRVLKSRGEADLHLFIYKVAAVIPPNLWVSIECFFHVRKIHECGEVIRAIVTGEVISRFPNILQSGQSTHVFKKLNKVAPCIDCTKPILFLDALH